MTDPIEHAKAAMQQEWTHAMLVERAERWLRNTKRCGIVFTERQTQALETPDAIGFGRGGLGGSPEVCTILVECKVSLSDFYADRRKTFRRMPDTGMGQYRYYMTPPNLVTNEMLPEKWGLLEVRGKIVRVICEAEKFDFHRMAELAILYSELRIQQMHDDAKAKRCAS